MCTTHCRAWMNVTEPNVHCIPEVIFYIQFVLYHTYGPVLYFSHHLFYYGMHPNYESEAKLWIWLFKSYIRGQLSFIFKCLSVWNEWVPRNCPLNKLILWDKTSFVFMIGLFSGPILWAWMLLICLVHKYDIFYTHSQQLWVVAAQPSVKNTKTFSKYKNGA